VAIVLDKGSGNVFLLDEPEVHLHPAFIKRLGKLLENLVRKERIQMLVITHSPLLIKHLSDVKDSLYLVRKGYVRTHFGGSRLSTQVMPSNEVFRNFPSIVIKKDIFFSDLILLVEGWTPWQMNLSLRCGILAQRDLP